MQLVWWVDPDFGPAMAVRTALAGAEEIEAEVEASLQLYIAVS